MARDRGDDLAGAQQTKRNGVNGAPVSSSSGPRSRTREGNQARDPRARERAAVAIQPRARPDSAVLHRDEGAALIAVLASEPARPQGRSPATPCAPASAVGGGEPA